MRSAIACFLIAAGVALNAPPAFGAEAVKTDSAPARASIDSSAGDFGNKTVLMEIGAGLHTSGKLADALEAFEKLKRLYPDDPEGYFGAGNVYASMGKRGEALENLIRARDMYHAAKSPDEADAAAAIEKIKGELDSGEGRETAKSHALKKYRLEVGGTLKVVLKSRGYNKPEKAGWHRTGLQIKPGETYLILVDGEYKSMLGMKEGDAGGYGGNISWLFGAGKILSDHPRGGVIGGINKKMFYIGNHLEYTAETEDDAGELFLGFNEKRVNRSGLFGNFTATIRRTE